MPLLAAGEFAPASEHLQRAVATPTQGWAPRGTHDLYVLLADIAADRRDAAALRRYLPPAEAAALEYDHRLYLGVVRRAQGVAKMISGDCGEAEADLRQALAIFEALGTQWQLGRTHLELGRLAAARADVEAALAGYGRAAGYFRAIGAEPDLARAGQLIAALRPGE